VGWRLVVGKVGCLPGWPVNWLHELMSCLRLSVSSCLMRFLIITPRVRRHEFWRAAVNVTGLGGGHALSITSRIEGGPV